MSISLILGDCLVEMAKMPDNSVDAIITDPPYFKVKKEAWDRQWDTTAGFIAWLDTVLEQFQRILKPNGSLYVFASPQMAARVEVKMGERFNVLNRARWIKDAGWHNKTDENILRSYLSPWEEIIFAEHYGADGYAKGEAGYGAKCDELRGFVFEPLRAYLDGERKRAGVLKEDCNAACGFSRSAGGMASRHYFSKSQWQLPTAEHYAKLQQLFNANGGEFLRREYEDLRREYEDLRRPFNATPDRPYTDVWTFPTVQAYAGKHPCEKPVALMEHIILTSTRKGQVVLDPFMGSGTTGVAAVQEGRSFIGIELDERYYEMAKNRIGAANLPLFA